MTSFRFENFVLEICLQDLNCNGNLHKNRPTVKKGQPCLKWPVQKSCEIKGGTQEMVVMIWVHSKNFNSYNLSQFVLLSLGISTKFD